MRIWVLALAVGLAACGKPPSVPPPTCQALFAAGPAPSDVEKLKGILEAAKGRFYPKLKGISLELVADPEQLYLSSTLDLETIESEPFERHYQVHYNPALLTDPPSRAAMGAILVHELKHVTDYTGLTAAELAQFAIWYGTSNVDRYERDTDLASLEAGCAEGLKAYRVWLYAHVDATTAEKKKLTYFTPEEIDAWVVAHPDVK